jgi:hypothetical protein
MATNYEVIKRAIKEKSAVSLNYKGYYRETCPHALGVKRNRHIVLVYQFGGESSSGVIQPKSKDNWRALVLDEITELKFIDAEWQSFSDHIIPANCFDYIEIEIEY